VSGVNTSPSAFVSAGFAFPICPGVVTGKFWFEADVLEANRVHAAKQMTTEKEENWVRAIFEDRSGILSLRLKFTRSISTSGRTFDRRSMRVMAIFRQLSGDEPLVNFLHPVQGYAPKLLIA